MDAKTVRMLNAMHVSEQEIQDLCENNTLELEHFAAEADSKYAAAKAVVNFVLAYHFASKDLTEEPNDDRT